MKLAAISCSVLNNRKLVQYGAAITVHLLATCVGMVLAWTSPAVALLKSDSTLKISDEDESWLASIIHLTAIVSSPFCSYVCQNFGRKICGYFCGTCIALGWLIMIIGDSIPYYYAGRVIQGFAFGGFTVFVTLYVAEIAEDNIRGTLGSFRGVLMNTGMLVMYGLGSFMSIRNLGITSIVMPLVFLACFFWLPESPMFLLGKGREEEAYKAYSWLRRGDTELVEQEMKKLRTVINMRTESMSLIEIVKVRGTRNALIIGIVLSFCTIFCGLLVVFSFASRLLKLSGSSISPGHATIIIGATNILGSLAALALTDLAGRKIILIVTQIVQALAMIGLGVYVYLREHDFDLSAPGLGLMPLICLVVFCFCSITGLMTLVFVIMSETFRPEARGLGMSVIGSEIFLLGFVATRCHIFLETYMGLYGAFWFYGCVSIMGAIFVFIRVPETKNRTLESILRELNGDPPVKENAQKAENT